jgi:hypothetical protein
MFILTAHNVTNPDGKMLARADGTARYDVWVGINQHAIWRGIIDGHIRNEGGAKLLRLIADAMEKSDA